jgi:hypothetical protein
MLASRGAISALPNSPYFYKRKRSGKSATTTREGVVSPGVTTGHELLRAALIGYQHQLDQLDVKIAEMRGQIGGKGSGPTSTPTTAASPGINPGAGRRTMSASARRKIATGQKRRWAEFHKARRKEGPPPKRRKMSAAGRERIAAATRKRWAEYRKQKKART